MDHKIPVNPDWPRKKTPESSLIEEVAYNTKDTLYVHFKTNNSVYSYNPITPNQWKAMDAAVSASGYFIKHIKGNKKIKFNSL